MDAQSNPPAQGIRSNLIAIEAIEQAIVFTLLYWWYTNANVEFSDVDEVISWFEFYFVLEIGLFVNWGIYNGFIRATRVCGLGRDIQLWIIWTLATGSATLFITTILDINRLIMSKLFYRGEAPVEYAWSHESKQRRRAWEADRKAVRS